MPILIAITIVSIYIVMVNYFVRHLIVMAIYSISIVSPFIWIARNIVSNHKVMAIDIISKYIVVAGIYIYLHPKLRTVEHEEGVQSSHGL